MSSFETMVWYFLGYASMPVIFITGFLITAVAACALLEMTGHGDP